MAHTSRLLQFRLSLSLVALGLLGASGCTADTCQRDSEVEVSFKGGITNPQRTLYQTSTWEGPWLTFPSGIRYALEHDLETEPVGMDVWLSLDDRPLASGEPFTPSAGNQSLVWLEDGKIVVSNDTCADVFIRLTAWTDAAQPTAIDAGTDAEAP
jgi:hypothetical protein